jgi:hypothetical protein
MEDSGLIKAKQAINSISAIHQTQKGHYAASHANVEHQIGNALVPIPEAEEVKLLAKVFQ